MKPAQPGLEARGIRLEGDIVALRTPADVERLAYGDRVRMRTNGAQMVLIFERRGEWDVLRCWELALGVSVPRGRRIGTIFHRMVEDRVRELGLHFCTADDATVGGNQVTSAMRDRLVKLYPDAIRVDDAWVLLGDRLPDPTRRT